MRLEWGWHFYAERLDRRKDEEVCSVVFNDQIDMPELSPGRIMMGNEVSNRFKL